MVAAKANSMFHDYCHHFQQAIADEIKALQQADRSMTPITDGHRISQDQSEQRRGEHLYSFTTDTEIRFPEDTPIDLHYNRQQYRGTLVSVDGFDLLIALETNIGDRIPKAKLNIEPWFLLEALQERLATANIRNSANSPAATPGSNGTSINDVPPANSPLAEALLSPYLQATPNSTEDFSQFAPRIEAETGLELRYNHHQAAAITHVLQHPVSFIWGPPGTGKTSTLGLAVAALVHSGQSVLVLAHSNAAVDTAMTSVAKYLEQSSYYRNGMVLRFGIPASDIHQRYPMLNVRGILRMQQPALIQEIEGLEQERERLTRESRQSQLSTSRKKVIDTQIKRIRDRLSELKRQLREHESRLVSQGMVIGCTLSKATIAPEIFERRFDAVIIDEASMAYIPHCAYGATLAKKRIAIFGDFRQLAPVSQAKTEAAAQWLQRDIFDEAGIIEAVNRDREDQRLVLLQTQYRMHPAISAIPNALFYQNRLEDGEGVRERTQTIVHAAPQPGHPLVLYDLSHAATVCCYQDRSSRFNLVSALIAADLTYQAQLAGSQSIGLITPYSAQARLLHRILRETQQRQVKVATVHRFQGSEQNLIVFDAVDSQPMRKASQLLRGGEQSTAARLANVAISRAEGKFIGLFNHAFISQQLDSFNSFRKFSDRLRANAEVIPLSFTGVPNTTIWEFQLPHVTAYANANAAQATIHTDLQAAQESIAIDWPMQLQPSRHFHLQFPCGRQLFVRGPHANTIARNLPNRHIWKNQSFSAMGLVGIDQKILWVYLDPANSNAPVFRIALPETIKLLYDFYELIPEGTGGSVATAFRQGDHPFGSCEICQRPLWLNSDNPNRLSCVRHPRQGRNMTPQDATRCAQLMQLVCPQCGAALRGARNSSTGQVYLRCTQCRGTRPL